MVRKGSDQQYLSCFQALFQQFFIVIPAECLNVAWMMLEWCLNDAWMMLEWCLNDVWMMFEWCLNDACMMLVWCLNDAWMMLLWCFYDAWMMLEWCLNDGIMTALKPDSIYRGTLYIESAFRAVINQAAFQHYSSTI